MTLDRSARTLHFYETWWFRPVIGVTVLVVILAAPPAYGRLTAGGKIDEGIPRTSQTVDVIVDLTTDVGAFHQQTLGELGVFSGRDRNHLTDRSRVRLQNVTQSDLDALSRLYWVERIEPS